MPSVTLRRSVLAFLSVAAVGCAGAQRAPVGPKGGTPAAPEKPAAAATEVPRAPDAVVSGLLFRVRPAEAQIAIDGSPRGAVADLADRGGLLPLAPGIYQVSLKAPGYVTWRAEVALRSGTESIRVDLTPKP